MHRVPALLLAAVATLASALPAVAQPAPAGVVERVQGNALAVHDAVPRVLAAGDPVVIGDVLSTGPASRLEIRLGDDAIFVLGETAAFVIVDYTFGQAGENIRLLRVIEGAFVATSGNLGPQVAENQMRIQTQVATIGIRGTTVWGGPLDDAFQVVVLDGAGVVVESAGAEVELTEGLGTTLPLAGGAPAAPVRWAAAKVARAVATVAFGP